MNAINFIQQHGVEKAREVVEGAPETATHFELTIDGVFYFKFEKFDWLCFGDNQLINTYMEDHESYLLISLEDLKRLVESVDLYNTELKTKKNAGRELMKACMRGQTERAQKIQKAIEVNNILKEKKS